MTSLRAERTFGTSVDESVTTPKSTGSKSGSPWLTCILSLLCVICRCSPMMLTWCTTCAYSPTGKHAEKGALTVFKPRAYLRFILGGILYLTCEEDVARVYMRSREATSHDRCRIDCHFHSTGNNATLRHLSASSHPKFDSKYNKSC